MSASPTRERPTPVDAAPRPGFAFDLTPVDRAVLESRLLDAASRWGLDGPPRYLESGRRSLVAEASGPRGTVIIKAFHDRVSVRSQLRSLELVGGKMTPEVYECDLGAGVMAIEKIPGRRPRPGEAGPRAVTSALLAYNRVRIQKGELWELPEWLDNFLILVGQGTSEASKAAIDSLAAEWPIVQERARGSRLLHGDVGRGNSLIDGRRLRFIDPVGARGNPALDWGTWLIRDAPGGQLDRRAARLARLGPFAVEEILFWGGVRARLNAAYHAALGATHQHRRMWSAWKMIEVLVRPA